jgi:hypothetical protein
MCCQALPDLSGVPVAVISFGVGVASLYHKARDDPVEERTIIKARVGKVDKVLDMI